MPTHQTVYELNAPAPALVDAALAGSERAVFWLQDSPGAAAARAARRVGHGGSDRGRRRLCRAVDRGEAKRRNPGARVVLLEGQEIGWAASGRNGGFCEASLTHGATNGRNRWPEEFDELEALGAANLDGFAADVAELGLDCQFERPGMITAAVETHQLDWAKAGPGYLTRDRDPGGDRQPAVPRRATGTGTAARWCTRPGSPTSWPGWPPSWVCRSTSTRRSPSWPRRAPVRSSVRTARGSVRSERVALATNVFPSLLRRARLLTVPIYDYALVTEPLRPAQQAAVGWRNRQGLADMANQFHYIRPTADDRILFGGYDAIYHYGGRVKESYEDRPASYRRLASHFFAMFPQLEGLRFTHRWAGAIDTCTQFCAFYGLARGGRVGYTAGFTGLGVGAARFAADVVLDLLGGGRPRAPG